MDPADPEDPGSRQDRAPDEPLPGQGGAPDEPPVPAQPRGRMRGTPRTRMTRRKKILAWAGGAAATLVVFGAVGAYLTYYHLNTNLRQVDVSGVLGRQPIDLHPQAENIMVLGSDTRTGQGWRYGNPNTMNADHSDTLMIVHIAADRKWADIVSIPRDSWVDIPACRMGNGQMSSPLTFKINEAFTYGTLYGNNTDLGVACTIRTVEKNTGIRIDHFVAINFAGFRDMVNAVGGVPECNSAPINDPKSGLHLTAGYHVLNGAQALGYVRARYTLGDGSDLGRIGRQQAFMSSLVDRVKSKLLNPVAVYQFLDAATKSITIDNQLGGIKGLYDMASSLKNLPPSQVTFFTLPTYPRYYIDPTDTANVMWTEPEDSLIFQAFRDDTPVTNAMLRTHRPAGLSPGAVSLAVLNGTYAGGLQDTVAAVLQQDGFKISRTGSAPTQTLTQTVIRYHPGQLPAAQLVAAKVHGAALLQVPGNGSALTLLLGSDYGTTAHTGPGQAPQPASSFAPRTASQNICT